jgi:hypothetical protein
MTPDPFTWDKTCSNLKHPTPIHTELAYTKIMFFKKIKSMTIE